MKQTRFSFSSFVRRPIALYKAYPVRASLLAVCAILLLVISSLGPAPTRLFTVSVVPRTTLADNNDTECKNIKVQSGDHLHEIFTTHNIDRSALRQLRAATVAFVGRLSRKEKASAPRIPDFLYSGDVLEICTKPSDTEADIEALASLTYSRRNATKVMYQYKPKDNGEFVLTQNTREVSKHVELVQFTVTSSLYADALRAGLSDSMIIAYADIFQWDINFVREVYLGDKVRMLLERWYVGAEPTGGYRILFAEYSKKNKNYVSYRYERDGELIGYFDEKGQAKKRRFLRWPLKFTRISSKFNPRRLHPILKKVRPHRGVDYAAPRHTKVYAVSRGKVIKSGWARGYGRRVIVDHGNGYTTLYAHLQKIPHSARLGALVNQGQVIGYVGTSGWATGPHLHYEFRVRGVHKNPVTVSLPGQPPIAKKYRADFRKFIAPLKHEYKARMRSATLS